MSGDCTPKIGDIVAVPMRIVEHPANYGGITFRRGNLEITSGNMPDDVTVGPIHEPKGGAE